MHQLLRDRLAPAFAALPRVCVKRLVIVACALFAAPLALAQGTVQGPLTLGKQQVALRFATALLHDNAEGLLRGEGPQLRILLSDVEVGPAGLQGIAFVPATQLAREGKVRGLLLAMKPADPHEVLATVLEQPAGGFSLASITLTSKPEPVIANYRMDGKTVSGTLKLSNMDAKSTGLTFSAPVVPVTPVSADLKGKAATDSPQVRAMRTRLQAMGRGDTATMLALSTPAERRQVEASMEKMGLEAGNMMRDAAREMQGTLARVERVVVRGDRAVVIFKAGESWQEMALIDGQWKTGK